MSKGLAIGLSVLAIGIVIPIVTIFLTLNNKPVYHTIQPEMEGCFVQFTWQEKPVANLEHVLIFLDKPEDYIAGEGVDMFPPEKTEGYYVVPRAVFYKNSNILASKKKVFRMAKKDVRTWILIKGKAFPVELEGDKLQQFKDLVSDFEDYKTVSASELGKKIQTTEAWSIISADLEDKREKLANGKLDLKPDRKRSDFMR